MVALAAYYSVMDRLFGEAETRQIPDVRMQNHSYSGNNILLSAFHKDAEKAASVMEEVLQTVKVLQPKMYDSAVRKLSDI